MAGEEIFEKPVPGNDGFQNGEKQQQMLGSTLPGNSDNLSPEVPNVGGEIRTCLQLKAAFAFASYRGRDIRPYEWR